MLTWEILQPAIFVLVLGILWLISQTYRLADFASIYDTSSSIFVVKEDVPDYLTITEAILDIGVTWVILIVMLFLGRIHDYAGGLYSTSNTTAPHWQPYQTQQMMYNGFPQNTGYQQAPQQQQQQPYMAPAPAPAPASAPAPAAAAAAAPSAP